MHNEELHNVHSAKYQGDQIKEKQQAGHVSRVGYKKRTQNFSHKSLKEGNHFEDVLANEMIILIWIFNM